MPVKISDLDAASTLAGTEVAPVVQSSTTKKATIAQIGDYVKTLFAVSGGAALVGYLPAGSDAEATTVQAKLRQIVSVLDFIPPAEHAAIKARTSTYDCTADFVSAIASNPGALYFPAGTYLGVLSITATNVDLIGDGEEQTILKNNSVNTDLITFASGASTRMSSIAGFGLNNNSLPCNTLYVATTYFKARNLKIYNHGNTTTDNKAGLYHTTATLITFENIDFLDNDLAYGSHIYSDACIGATYMNITAGKGNTTAAAASAKPGIYIYGGTVINIQNMYVDPGAGGSMFIDQCASVTINGLAGENDVDRNHTGVLGMFKFTNTTSLTINGLYFNQHATTAGSVIPIIYLDELDECSIRGVRLLRDANEATVPMLVMQDLSGFRLSDVTLGNWTNTGHGTPLNFKFSDNDLTGLDRGGERYEFKNISSEAGTPSYAWKNPEGLISDNVIGTYTMTGTTAHVGGVDQFSPAFSARVGTLIENVTGDAGGTVYTIIFGTEEFDTNGNYAVGTGIFTAPVGGRYQFNTNVVLAGLDASHTLGIVLLVNSVATDCIVATGNFAAMRASTNELVLSGSVAFELAQSETVKVTVSVTGTAQSVDIGTGSFFSGFLLK